jgi:hypothetical protein
MLNKQLGGKMNIHKFLKKTVLFCFAAALVLGLSFEASAKKKRSGGVIRLEETVIEGRVAKPNAFFINTRQALVYDTMEISHSFIPEIIKAVKNGPF